MIGPSGTVGMLTWMPSTRSRCISPTVVVIAEPQSPPCAPKRSYPSRLINVAHACAIQGIPRPRVDGLLAEPVARQRRADDVEGVGGVAAVRDRIGQRTDHVEELDVGTGPAVRDHQRHRVGFGRAGVHEVDVEVVDPGRELRPRVHALLGRSEVVLVAPVGREVLHERERDALRPVVDGLGFGPARVPQARPQVVDRVGVERHPERDEIGVGHQTTPSRRKVSWSVRAAARRGMWTSTTARELIRVITHRK